jgi:uncharacterized membrane protein
VKKRTILQEFRFHQSAMKENAKEKARESMSAVLPIVLIVLALGFTIAALSPSILVEFLIGAVLVVAGMLFFSIGAELSMTPMGEHVGGSMLRTRKLGFIVILGFILGFIITISFLLNSSRYPYSSIISFSSYSPYTSITDTTVFPGSDRNSCPAFCEPFSSSPPFIR